MDTLLFLLVVGALGAVYLVSKRARERSRANEERIARLNVEIQATRSALLRRISALEEKLDQQTAVERPAAEASAREASTDKPAAAVPPPFPAAPTAPVTPPAPPVETKPPIAAKPYEPSTAPTGEAPPPVAPPPPVPPSRQPPLKTPPPSSGVDWEQWIGIRGAAVLGAIVLALAAVMFLRYTIEHDLIPPIVRVAIGVIVGLASIAASEALRKRDYTTTADALAGGGIVVLYVSTWSARVLYELIGTGFAYGLMILITVTCGLLSWRHRARLTAVLGLVGGFATPILLSTGSDNPIGLFSYVLLLDLGLLTLARRRGWPGLMMLALAGTVFYQAAWILMRMGPERTVLGLGILGVFGVFFALTGRLRPADDDDPRQAQSQRLTQLAGLLLPIAFAFYFAGNADLGPHLYPVAALLLLLLAAACWMGRVQELPLLPTAAAAGTAGVVAVWFMRTRFDDALAWEATAVCFVLALAPHLFFEYDLRAGEHETPSVSVWPAWITSLGFLSLLILFCVDPPSPSLWPWLCGWLALAGLGLRQATRTGHRWIQALIAWALGVGFSIFFLDHRRTSAFPLPELYFAIVVLVAVGFHTLALWRRELKAKLAADIAAATLPLTLLAFLTAESGDPHLTPVLFLVASFVLAFLAALSATRMASGGVYFAAVMLLAFDHWLWTISYPWTGNPEPAALLAFLLQLVPVIVFSFWPLLVGTVFREQRWAWYAAALAAPVWFVALRALFEIRFGDAAIGLLPVALGAVSLAAAYQVRGLRPTRGSGAPEGTGVVLRRRVGLPERRHSSATREAVDHVGLGVAGSCGDCALEASGPPWAEVLRAGAVGGGDRPPGGEP